MFQSLHALALSLKDCQRKVKTTDKLQNNIQGLLGDEKMRLRLSVSVVGHNKLRTGGGDLGYEMAIRGRNIGKLKSYSQYIDRKEL